mmetsp:Transcript_97157/g.299450  ORF Transcript_97157/g.299450 Transcript_97157/m.299450 type:complete len:301 (+) Transcript_97157:3-905(+)
MKVSICRLAFLCHGGALPRACKIALPNALFCIVVKTLTLNGQSAVGDYLRESWEVKSAGFQTFSGLLALFLVFRSSQAYSRYWEGCGLVNQMTGSFFDAACSVMSFTRMSKADVGHGVPADGHSPDEPHERGGPHGAGRPEGLEGVRARAGGYRVGGLRRGDSGYRAAERAEGSPGVFLVAVSCCPSRRRRGAERPAAAAFALVCRARQRHGPLRECVQADGCAVPPLLHPGHHLVARDALGAHAADGADVDAQAFAGVLLLLPDGGRLLVALLHLRAAGGALWRGRHGHRRGLPAATFQ